MAVGGGLVSCLVMERDGRWVWGCGEREKLLFGEVVRRWDGVEDGREDEGVL